jgi:hypothetical protein
MDKLKKQIEDLYNTMNNLNIKYDDNKSHMKKDCDQNSCSKQVKSKTTYSNLTQRYHEDPEYREKVKARERARYAKLSKEKKDIIKRRILDKYHTDDEYRIKARIRSKEWIKQKRLNDKSLKEAKQINTSMPK